MNRKTAIMTLLYALLITTVPAWSQSILPNGTFDSDLANWTVEVTNADSVLWYDQAAVFLNPGELPLDPTWPFQDSFSFLNLYPTPAGSNLDYSAMYQTITLPTNAAFISFDVTMEVYNRMSMGETDVFAAYVWYGPGYEQSQRIYRLTSTDVEFYATDFLVNEMDNDGLNWTHHVIYNTNCSYDISQWAGQSVIIEFVLDHDYYDGVRTAVTLDDVAIAVAGDTTPPAVEVGEMMELWPPNHKYRTFNLSDCVLSVGDDTDGQLDIDAVGTITSITSDEPEDVDGKGDGNTTDDIVILGTSSFKVRAERQGAGNGRIYTVHFVVVDAAGNETEAAIYLGVPHDQGHDDPIIDDGPQTGYIINSF